MAEREPMIVIKKITINAAGHHGGAWKVAFADFMTALMAFFLVMWLVNATEEVKQNVSDYFSTPSIIEYNFSNYGVELTLEKLFLDLMNEPLRFFEQFITPVDHTPNIMMMGTKKIVMHHLAEKLGDKAQGVEVNEDQITFKIPADLIFVGGTAKPSRDFVEIMNEVKGLTEGLEDSNIFVDSQIYHQEAYDGRASTANNVADERLDLVLRKIEISLEHETVDIYGKTSVSSMPSDKRKERSRSGFIRIKLKQKPVTSDGRKPRKLESIFGETDESMSVYDNFVNQVVNQKDSKKK